MPDRVPAPMTDKGRRGPPASSPQGWSAAGEAGERERWALVADRNSLLREGLRLYLETLGWRVMAGETVEEGMALLARCPLPPSGPLAPDLIVMGEMGVQRRDASGAWPPVFDRLAAMRRTVRPLLLSIAAANHDLIIRAQDRGFETIHIDIPPLNLEELLLDCVRRIEHE